jgi:hypothetical protein
VGPKRKLNKQIEKGTRKQKEGRRKDKLNKKDIKIQN